MGLRLKNLALSSLTGLLPCITVELDRLKETKETRMMNRLNQMRKYLGWQWTDQKVLTDQQVEDIAHGHWTTPLRRCSFLAEPSACLVISTAADAPGLTTACGGTIRNVPTRPYDIATDTQCSACQLTVSGEVPPIHPCPTGQSKYWHTGI